MSLKEESNLKKQEQFLKSGYYHVEIGSTIKSGVVTESKQKGKLCRQTDMYVCV